MIFLDDGRVMSEVATPSQWPLQPWPELVAWLTLRTTGRESSGVGAQGVGAQMVAAQGVAAPEGPAAEEERR
jgi:hypothetical protein